MIALGAARAGCGSPFRRYPLVVSSTLTHRLMMAAPSAFHPFQMQMVGAPIALTQWNASGGKLVTGCCRLKVEPSIHP